jgi:hypothetical protein
MTRITAGSAIADFKDFIPNLLGNIPLPVENKAGAAASKGFSPPTAAP